MKIRSKLFRLVLFLVLNLNLILILFSSVTYAQNFTIDKFHSDITIHEDSSFIVKETIDVKFHSPRHGIYREIPFKYRDDLGKTIETPLKVLSVTDGSGKSWKYKVDRMGHVINVRIGDANKFVGGNQTYVITYQVENAILFLDDHEELYWNVTGNEWKVPIREASAGVTLSVKGKSKDLWAAGYVGRYGSKEECGYETYDNSGNFFAKRNLLVGEGLTVVFGWEKGLVFTPSSWKRFLWAIHLRENWVFFLPFFSLVFMVSLWYPKRKRSKS